MSDLDNAVFISINLALVVGAVYCIYRQIRDNDLTPRG